MTQYISKDALVAEIIRRRKAIPKEEDDKRLKAVYGNEAFVLTELLEYIDTLEVKEVDLELIVGWFEHIAQMADDRKTLNGEVMDDWAALDEIKCLAKNSADFIQRHYKAQKGECV